MASRRKSTRSAKRKAAAPKKSTKKKAAPRKSAKKKPAAKKTGKKAGSRRDPLAPRDVKTGTGSTPGEIGASLVDLFNRGLLHEIEAMWWSPKITSIEGIGQAWDGRPAVEGKNAWWAQTNQMISGLAEGPYVGATGFSVKFHLEVEDKATGQRTVMDEVGVYTIKDGKIIQEEFMYGMPLSASPTERV